MRVPGSHTRNAAAILVTGSVYLAIFAGVLSRIGDEGTLVNGAALTAAGALPYRDFADLANPLSYYWLAGWFTLFGTSFAVARVLLVLTGAASGALVYWLTARAYGVTAGLQAALMTIVLGVPMWPGTSHHWDSNLFFFATLACLALWHERPRFASGVVAGVCAAVTTGFMIDKGPMACVVALTLVGRQTSPGAFRRLSAVAIGAAGGVIAICLWFYLHGAWREFVYVNVIFPATRYDNTRHLPYGFYFTDLAWHEPMRLLSRIVPVTVAHVLTVILAVPLAVVVATPLLAALVLLRHAVRRERLNDAQLLLWAGGVALLISEAHRPDLYHLLYGAPLLLGAVLGDAARPARGSWFRRATGAATVSTAFLAVWLGTLAMAARVPQDTRRGTVRGHAFNEALQFLTEHTQPGDYAYVYPYYAMYYFLADVRNPTRFAILMPGYNTVEQFQDAVASLERAQPRYVLWDTTVDGATWSRWYPGYVTPPASELVVESYLRQHYREIDTLSGFRVMERLAEPGGQTAPAP